eukprot:5536281-Ditylum_brightwellii.AAC.1
MYDIKAYGDNKMPPHPPYPMFMLPTNATYDIHTIRTNKSSFGFVSNILGSYLSYIITQRNKNITSFLNWALADDYNADFVPR